MHDIRFPVPPRAASAITLLLNSYDYASDSRVDSQQFAVELSEFLSAGGRLADVRWLIHRGFAKHALETTIPGDHDRSFRPLPRASFPPDLCLWLTTAGANCLRPLLATNGQPLSQHKATSNLIPMQGAAGANLTAGANSDPIQRASNESGIRTRNRLNAPRRASPTLKPIWDAMLHELRLGNEVVKRFTRPASAQELVLAAFQEDGWPPAIDDPLPAQFNQDPKRHLHYTVRNLNRGQTPLRIRFYINGNGETIRWELVPDQRAIGARNSQRRK